MIASDVHPATSTSTITQANMSAISPCVSNISPFVVSAISCLSPTQPPLTRPMATPKVKLNSIQAPSAPCSVISPNSSPMLQSQARALSQSQ